MNKLIQSTFIVSFCTLISRVLGYARDVIIAIKLGTSILNDAFVVAFRLTNMFRNIFAEGALNLVFVPEFSQVLKEKGKKRSPDIRFKSTFFTITHSSYFLHFSNHSNARTYMAYNTRV